jgi:hypothetical protein
MSLCPSETVRSTFPLKCDIPEDSFTWHDSAATLIFIWATAVQFTAKSGSTLLNCTWVLKYHTFYGRTDSRKATFYVILIWRMLFIGNHQYLSTGCNSIGMVQVSRKYTVFYDGWLQSAGSGRHYQIIPVTVRLLLTAHSQQTQSPPSWNCFLLLCTIPHMSRYLSLLDLQQVTGFTVLPYCFCLLFSILFLPFETCFIFILNYTQITKTQIKLLPLNYPPNIVLILLFARASCKQRITVIFAIPYKLLIMPQAFCCLHYSFAKTKEM